MRNLLLSFTFILFAFTNNLSAQYCGSWGTNNADYIQSVEFAFSTSTTGNDWGYGNRLSHTFHLDQGLPLPIRLTPSNLSKIYMWSIWIDLDQNGSFEETELIYTTAYSFIVGWEGILEDNIILPASAALGNTRMRVQMFEMAGGLDDFDPCRRYGNGEVEDYTLNVSGTCTSKGTAFGIDSYYYINSVSLNGDTNLSESDSGYGDYTNHTTVVDKGTALNIVLEAEHWDTFGSGTTRHWRIFFDFNGDNDFSDSGERYTIVNSDDFSANINIPTSAVEGAIRMRIQYGIYTDGNACLNDFHGETEDYTLIISDADDYCNSYGKINGIQWISQIGLGDYTFDTDYSYGYNNNGDLPIAILSSGSTVDYNFEFTETLNFNDIVHTYWSLYIDFNENNTFEASERLTNLHNFIGEGTFSIPASVSAGIKRARLQLSYDDGVFHNACSKIEFAGDVIDFAIEIEGSSDAYCTASSVSVGYEFIDEVQLGDYTYASCGCVGYEFDETLVYPMTIGTNSLRLSPGYHFGNYPEYWSVWIDLNQDNDFDDTGERVFNTPYSQIGNVTTSINIPSSAMTGTTRMRIVMKYDTTPSACGIFEAGQVLDLLVNIEPSYCDSEGNSTYEWIETVAFANITTAATLYTSGNNSGYANFTDEHTFHLAKNQWMAFTGTPGYAGSAYPEQWDIWIDFNHDGDFNDTNEHPSFYYANLSGEGSHLGRFDDYIWIPASAMTGKTTMRIAMHYYNGDNPCADYSYGEVEDYSVIISSTSALVQADEPAESVHIKTRKSYDTPTQESGKRLAIETANITTDIPQKTKADLNIFPNPSKGLSTLQIKFKKASKASIQIMASSGQIVQQYEISETKFVDQQIDITNQAAGTYFVHVITPTQSYTKLLNKVE